MRRKTLGDALCPVARSLDVIGDWWSLLIVRDALNGSRRFKEFEQSLGIAKNILSTRLKSLVAHGILDIVPATDGSAYHEYAPTDKGRELFVVIIALRQWGADHLFGPEAPAAGLVDAREKKPLPRLRVVAEDGHELGAGDINLSSH